MFAQGAFTNDANATPEEVSRKRAMIAALMPRFGNARYVGEGIGQAATGYMIGRQNKRLDAQEAAGRQSASEMFDRLFSGGGGFASKSYGGSPSGTWTPDAPAPKPTEAHMGMPDVARGGLSFGMPKATPEGAGGLDFGSAVMTPQEMLIAGAEKRGLNPIDVATAISYETGGKFDPLIKGPTTQWGTHEGLIQFGDPQGQQHGAVFDQGPDEAWRSQLDPTNGAVWSYLDSTGVKPGMGLPEVYSAINAGSVGRMGASDANNGGAPGTVADKVAGMAPHRDKAAAFLGGTWTADPNATQGGGNVTMSAQNAPSAPQIPMQDLLAAMANPWLAPEQRAVISTLYEQQVQASDPLYQMQLQREQLELAQLQNPQQKAPEDFTERMFTLNSLGIDPQSEEGRVYLMTGALAEPEKPDAPPNSVQEYEYYKQGAIARGETPMPYEAFIVADEKAGNPAAGNYTSPVTKGQEEVDKAYAKEYVEWTQGGGADMAGQIATVESIADRLEDGTENLSGPAVGSQPDWLGAWLTPNAVSAREDVESVVQRNLRILLGAQFTQAEGDRLIARAYNPKLPEAENAKRLRKLTVAMRAAAEARQSQAEYYNQNGTLTGWTGKVYTPADFEAAIDGPDAPPAPASDDGWTTLPSGVKVRVKQ